MNNKTKIHSFLLVLFIFAVSTRCFAVQLLDPSPQNYPYPDSVAGLDNLLRQDYRARPLKGLSALTLSVKVLDGFKNDQALSDRILEAAAKSLRSTGLTVNQISSENSWNSAFLHIDVVHSVDESLEHNYNLRLTLWQPLKLSRDESIEFAMPTWQREKKGVSKFPGPIEVQETVYRELSTFITDWLSVNPQVPKK